MHPPKAALSSSPTTPLASPPLPHFTLPSSSACPTPHATRNLHHDFISFSQLVLPRESPPLHPRREPSQAPCSPVSSDFVAPQGRWAPSTPHVSFPFDAVAFSLAQTLTHPPPSGSRFPPLLRRCTPSHAPPTGACIALIRCHTARFTPPSLHLVRPHLRPASPPTSPTIPATAPGCARRHPQLNRAPHSPLCCFPSTLPLLSVAPQPLAAHPTHPCALGPLDASPFRLFDRLL